MIDNVKLAEIELTIENTKNNPKFKGNKVMEHLVFLLDVIREQTKQLEYCKKHHMEAGD